MHELKHEAFRKHLIILVRFADVYHRPNELRRRTYAPLEPLSLRQSIASAVSSGIISSDIVKPPRWYLHPARNALAVWCRACEHYTMLM